MTPNKTGKIVILHLDSNTKYLGELCIESPDKRYKVIPYEKKIEQVYFYGAEDKCGGYNKKGNYVFRYSPTMLLTADGWDVVYKEFTGPVNYLKPIEAHIREFEKRKIGASVELSREDVSKNAPYKPGEYGDLYTMYAPKPTGLEKISNNIPEQADSFRISPYNKGYYVRFYNLRDFYRLGLAV